MKSEQIEDMLAKLDEIGINVVETKEADLEEEVATQENPEEEADSDTELVEVRQRPVSIQSGLKESAERTSDPVGIYLREMGSVELLSREGEIAIAKRIEAGREAMIAGLSRARSRSRPSSSGGTNSTQARYFFAISSTSTRPTLAPMPRPYRRRRLVPAAS